MKPNKNDIVFFAHILPSFGVYELLEMKCRTSEDTYVVICNKDRTYLLHNKICENVLFINRKDCLKYLNEQKELHKNEKKYSDD